MFLTSLLDAKVIKLPIFSQKQPFLCMKVFENKLRIDLNDNTSLKFYLCNKLKKDRMVFYDDEINFQEEVFYGVVH